VSALGILIQQALYCPQPKNSLKLVYQLRSSPRLKKRRYT